MRAGDSGLGERLEAVRADIRHRLDQKGSGPVGIISACAGGGRELLSVLAGGRMLGELAHC